LHETGHSVVKFESLDPEIRGVLGKKVSELGLKVEGSPVESYVSSCTRSSSAAAEEVPARVLPD
jgi:hypothetical protein